MLTRPERKSEKRHPERRGWMTGDAKLNCLVKLNNTYSIFFHWIFDLFFLHFSKQYWSRLTFLSLSVAIKWSAKWRKGTTDEKKMYKVSGTNVIIGDTDECGKVFSVSKLKRTFAIEVAGGEHQNHRRKKEPERRKKGTALRCFDCKNECTFHVRLQRFSLNF